VFGLLAASGILAVQIAFFYHGTESIYDDAFITFRYSRNLAHGLGPVFNAGEPVEGYTNFLWMLILAGAIRLSVSAESASLVIGIALALALLFTTYKLGRAAGLDRLLGILPVLLLAGTASYARYSVSGMETILFTLWVTLGFLISLSGADVLLKSGLTSSAMVMAALTRPEGLLFWGLLFLYQLYLASRAVQGRESRRNVVLKVSVAWSVPWLLIFLPYLLWRLTYYGYWLPNTFYAKVGTGSLTLLRRGVKYLVLMIPVVNPQILLLMLCLPWLRWSSSRCFMMVSVLACFAYLVYVGGDDYTVFGPRLMLPVFPVLYVLGVSSLIDLLQRIGPVWRVPAQMGIGIILAIVLSVYARTERLAYVQLMRTTTQGWLSAAQWMAETLSSDALVAVDAAGIIPFYTNLETIDMYGLNDAHIAHAPSPNTGAGLAGHEKFDPVYVMSRKPDFVTVWIDSQGWPSAAGLGSYAGEFLSDYSLSAVVLMHPPSQGEARILLTRTHNSELYDQGYIYGLFSRREGN
jgi:arabinofuranosyltransferase